MEEQTFTIRPYDDYTIRYNSSRGKFEAVKDDDVKLSADKEEELVTKIDAAIKRQEKAAKSKTFPMAIFYKDYNSLYDGKITSVAEDGDLWITWVVNKETQRQKMSIRWGRDLYPINDKTKAIKEKVDGLVLRRDAIGKDIVTAMSELGTPLDVQSLIDKES